MARAPGDAALPTYNSGGFGAGGGKGDGVRGGPPGGGGKPAGVNTCFFMMTYLEHSERAIDLELSGDGRLDR